jgi:hypothetical protein
MTRSDVRRVAQLSNAIRARVFGLLSFPLAMKSDALAVGDGEPPVLRTDAN